MIILANTAAAINDIGQRISRTQAFGFDTESSGPQLVGERMLNVYQSRLTGYSVAFGDGAAYYVPVRHVRGNAPTYAALSLLADITRHPGAYVHNLVHELQVLKQEGVPPCEGWSCTQVLMWMLGRRSDNERRPFGLKELAKTYLNMDMRTFQEVTGGRQFSELDPAEGLQYACDDAIAALGLARMFLPDMERLELMTPYTQQELPSLRVIQHMQESGFDLDTDYLTKLAEELTILQQKIRDEWTFAFPEVDIASSVQISDYFYGGGLWNPIGISKGKSGRYTTNAEALELMLDRCPPGSEGRLAAQLKLDYQAIDKNLSTYTTGLVEKALQHTDRRIHCDYHPTGTATGRWSSSGPNLQNIPVRTEMGRRVKAAFYAAREDEILVAADYSQIELRVLAHFAGAGKLAEAYQQGKDIHQQTADLVGISRDQGKTTNFAIIYGAAENRLSKTLGVSREEAGRILRGIKRAYPEIDTLGDRILSAARKRGMVRTLSRRVRIIEGLQSPDRMERWSAERKAKNTPIQGSAGDLMKIAMNNFYAKMRDSGELGTRVWMVANVHDEVTLRVKREIAEEAGQELAKCMETAATLRVPLVAEPKYGKRWTECK